MRHQGMDRDVVPSLPRQPAAQPVGARHKRSQAIARVIRSGVGRFGRSTNNFERGLGQVWRRGDLFPTMGCLLVDKICRKSPREDSRVVAVMRVCGMRTGITVDVKAADRARLEAIVADRNSPQKHVWRARIVLLTADGLGTNEIMRQTAKSKTCLWRWQERFMQSGVEGLLHDRTRPSRVPPLPPAIGEHVVALTQSDPPGETTHWTAAAMAALARISVSSVQRIWRSHGLQPHRVRQFKLSRDPEFIPKLRDIVGLYIDPPPHAMVLSVDEKSQIQALDRTQPGLPIKPGLCGTMTHDLYG